MNNVHVLIVGFSMFVAVSCNFYDPSLLNILPILKQNVFFLNPEYINERRCVHCSATFHNEYIIEFFCITKNRPF